tara:strand:+ start:895 stop:1776 length:882 start_codon:yes stop_codon:yes gene_type:complete
MRVLITLLLAALPMQLLADVDCSVVDALERVQFAQLRLAQSRKIDPNSIDAQLIIREVGRLDAAKVGFATSAELTTRDAARLASFFAMSETLRQTLINQRPDQSSAIFQAPSFTQHISNVKRILPLLNCNPLTGVQGKDGTEKVSSTLGESKAGKKIPITKIGFWFAGLVVAGALASAIKSAISTLQKRQKRRAKRYRVHIPARIRTQAALRDGTILDISGNGVKIQVDKLETDAHGARLDIWLDDAWHGAHISWSNSHYIGVQFVHAFAHARVLALSEQERKSLLKTKTAPV